MLKQQSVNEVTSGSTLCTLINPSIKILQLINALNLLAMTIYQVCDYFM